MTVAAAQDKSVIHRLNDVIVTNRAAHIVDAAADGAVNAAVNASEAHALNATFSDTEVEAALNALAVIVNANAVKYNAAIVKANANAVKFNAALVVLERLGATATS